MIKRKTKPPISNREALVLCVLLSTTELINLLAFPERLNRSEADQDKIAKAAHTTLLKRFEHYQVLFGKSIFHG